MTDRRFSRMALLLPQKATARLFHAHAVLFGLGGVGSYAAEALARLGVGRITLVDADTVDESNINRQLPALGSTVGKSKASVVSARLSDINPQAVIEAIEAFYLPESPVPIPQSADVVLDAIDTVSAKLDIAEKCAARNLPLISCMGMGNRLDPTQIRIGDLYETAGCPLCRVMRRELRKRGVSALRCVYSVEPALPPAQGETKSSGHPAPGSIAVVPSVAGLYMAYEAARLLCGEDWPRR